jgi:hypothetical protein
MQIFKMLASQKLAIKLFDSEEYFDHSQEQQEQIEAIVIYK